MTIEPWKPAGTPAVTTPSAADALHAVVRGSPPVQHWQDLGAWLAARGEIPALTEATVTWLVTRRTGSDHTRNAYASDLSRWFAWCRARGTHPGAARNQEADLYAAACREAGLGKATVNRRLSTVSAWYKYALRAGVVTVSPVDGMERPKVANVSGTRGMSKRELAALLACARTYPWGEPGDSQDARDTYQDSLKSGKPLSYHALNEAFGHPRESAWARYRIRETQGGALTGTETAGVGKRAYTLLLTMAATASRIGAILAADVSDLGHDSGHRVLDLTVKGDERKRFVLPPPAVAAIEDYLGGRTEGPLFITANGARLDRFYVSKLIKRIAAKAGIPHAVSLSPHSMRHTVATILLSSGHELQIVQGLLGHVDPRTTQRYNLARESLENSPAGDMVDLIAAEMRLLESEN